MLEILQDSCMNTILILKTKSRRGKVRVPGLYVSNLSNSSKYPLTKVQTFPGASIYLNFKVKLGKLF